MTKFHVALAEELKDKNLYGSIGLIVHGNLPTIVGWLAPIGRSEKGPETGGDS